MTNYLHPYGKGSKPPERDESGRVIQPDDPSKYSPQMREARKRQQGNAKARVAMQARRMRERLDRIRERDLAELAREQQAKRELEEYAKKLASEVRYAKSLNEPNPWLSLGDVGYEDPLEFQIRRRLQRGLDPLAPEPQRGNAPAYRCIGHSPGTGHSVGSPAMLENGRCFGCRQKQRARGNTGQRPSLSSPTEWRAHATGGHEHPLSGPCSVCRRPRR